MGVAIKKKGRGAVPLTKQAVRLVERLPKKYAKAAVKLYSELAPRSDNDEPGHVHMADSMTAKPGRESAGRSEWKIEVEKDYAQYPEFGTIHQDAQPAFRPTVASMKRGIRDEFKKAIPKR